MPGGGVMKCYMANRMSTMLIAVFFVVIALSSYGFAQDQGFVYSFVMNQTGQPVTDLTPEDFVVTEDGNEAEVIAADIMSEPMKIALMVDNGIRIRTGQAINPLRDAVTSFLETLPPQHLVSLYTIGGNIRRILDFTDDREELVKEGQAIFSDAGDTLRMLDGIRETLERRFDGDETWPVFVMVLTDAPEGSAFMNQNRYNQFMQNLREKGVIVHAILWSSQNKSNNTEGFAINLAQNTGGRFQSLAAVNGMEEVLAQLAVDMGNHYDEVSSRYRVVWNRPDPRGERISVSVKRPGVGVRLFGDRRLD